MPYDLDAVDLAVKMTDSDRSKFVRAAIREKLARLQKLRKEAA